MMTKLLRYSPWPEAYAELVDLALDKDEGWLPREGALYALGALGNKGAGPHVLEILSDPDCPPGVHLVAITTLARIGYRGAASAIRRFTEHEDIHMQLFANQALAQLGEPVDEQFLFSALQSADYTVREEACGALAHIDGKEVTERLETLAERDANEAVRICARVALLNREIAAQTAEGKLEILRRALVTADQRTAIWIIQTVLDQCGRDGRLFVELLAARNDRFGERARAFLLLKAAQ